MVRQSFWSSPNHPVNPWARLLFMAMWNFADDYGVGSCSTRELLGFAFPNDRNITESDLEQLLCDVGEAYGVVYYTVGGRPYYHIPSWASHQKVPHPSKTRNPTVDQAESFIYQQEQQTYSSSHDTLMTDAVDTLQLSADLSPKDKYKEKEKEKIKPPPSSGVQGGAGTRGSRLPEDWVPPQHVREQLAAKYPNTRLDLILQEFINYWTALPGAKARKLDWTKTFINRVNERAHAPQFQIRPNGQRTGTETAYAKLSQLAEKYSQEEAHAQLPAGRGEGNDESQGILAPGQYR